MRSIRILFLVFTTGPLVYAVPIGKVRQIDKEGQRVVVEYEAEPEIATGEQLVLTYEDGSQCMLQALDRQGALVFAGTAKCPEEREITVGLPVEKSLFPAKAPEAAPEVAQEPAPEPVASPEPVITRWSIALVFGSARDAKTDLEIKKTSGEKVGSTDHKGAGAPATLGVELIAHSTQYPLGVAFLATMNRYGYSGDGYDGHFAFVAVPRFEHRNEAVTAWAGLGLGFAETSLASSAGASGSIAVSLPKTTTGVMLSPRIGLDFHLGSHVTLGVQASYVYLAGEMEGTVSSGSTSANFKVGYERTWHDLALRFGLRF